MVWPELGQDGARRGAERGDVVVIMDALRASVTIIAALHAGATHVRPVLTVPEAENYRCDAQHRVAGERNGARLPHFHYGNSPTEILAHQADIAGRALVLTTSNGTRCTLAALGAAAILIGAPINARACAQAAFERAQAARCGITLVAVGINDEPTEEDTYSQGLIGGYLIELGAQAAAPLPSAVPAACLDVFLSARPAARLIALGYFQDIHFCAQIDLWDIVPVYQDGVFVIAPTTSGCLGREICDAG